MLHLHIHVRTNIVSRRHTIVTQNAPTAAAAAD
jgi:hypothetical protein